MNELPRFALSRTERNLVRAAERLSVRMGLVYLWLLSLGPILLVGIAAWRGRIELHTLLMAAFLLALGHAIHLYRVLHHIIQRQGAEIAALTGREDSSE